MQTGSVVKIEEIHKTNRNCFRKIGLYICNKKKCTYCGHSYFQNTNAGSCFKGDIADAEEDKQK